nr:MAG TPA: hypothetical protein [Caudoviricetes sp.]
MSLNNNISDYKNNTSRPIFKVFNRKQHHQMTLFSIRTIFSPDPEPRLYLPGLSQN